MKKILLFITILTFGISSVNAQDSNFYLGVGAGYATVGGDEDLVDTVKGGIALNFINMGYRFNETWGVTANLASAGHAYEDYDAAVGIGTFSVGPMYSFPAGNMTWDLKPQIIVSMSGVLKGDDVGDDVEDLEWKGSGLIIGNSLVMDGGQGFTWSIDFDYVMGNFDEVEGDGGSVDVDADYNSLRIGVGVRYNF